MNRLLFLALLTGLLLCALGIFCSQHSALAEARVRLETRTALPATKNTKPIPGGLSRPIPPSPELLRLRAEVSSLRRELDAVPPHPLSKQEASNDWAYVHSGPKPSQLPGFIAFTNLADVGFATPEAALQSFGYAFRHQNEQPMTDTRMKDLYVVPDDYDDPNAGYSIDLGEGMSDEIGYRVLSEERLATNEIRLTLDLEKPDGSSSRRQKILVEDRGRWRVRPVSVKRAVRKH